MIDVGDLLLIVPAASLDSQGRCCGRKPIEYRRTSQLFCHRCDRSYDPATGRQQDNFAWTAAPDGFRRSENTACAAVATNAWRHHKESGMTRDDFAQAVLDIVDEFRNRYRKAFVS